MSSDVAGEIARATYGTASGSQLAGGEGLVAGGDEAQCEIAAEDECSICLSVLYRPVAPATCSHSFCEVCLYKAGLRQHTCPLCRAPFAKGFNVHKLVVVPGADEVK